MSNQNLPMKPGITRALWVAGLLAALVFALSAGRSVWRSAEAKPSDRVAPGNRPAVVVELFTSEGCSSCPPADNVLSWLDAHQPLPGVEIIPLSEHVDYWNHLGWADPYSSASFSTRQREYSESLRGGVYTPQMIVDGKVQFVGGDRDEAIEAISKASRTSRADVRIQPTTPANPSSHNAVSFSVQVEKIPLNGAREKGLVFLAVTESNLQSSVAGGENSGRNLKHTAVVRDLKMIGRIEASPDASFVAQPSVKISNAWKVQNLRAVVFIQLQSTHKILGAAESEFPTP